MNLYLIKFNCDKGGSFKGEIYSDEAYVVAESLESSINLLKQNLKYEIIDIVESKKEISDINYIQKNMDNIERRIGDDYKCSGCGKINRILVKK